MSVERRLEVRLVVIQRGEGPDAREYRRTSFDKRDMEHAYKGLLDWRANRQRVLEANARYIHNWSAHIETRNVTETPWERFET